MAGRRAAATALGAGLAGGRITVGEFGQERVGESEVGEEKQCRRSGNQDFWGDMWLRDPHVIETWSVILAIAHKLNGKTSIIQLLQHK